MSIYIFHFLKLFFIPEPLNNFLISSHKPHPTIPTFQIPFNPLIFQAFHARSYHRSPTRNLLFAHRHLALQTSRHEPPPQTHTHRTHHPCPIYYTRNRPTPIIAIRIKHQALAYYEYQTQANECPMHALLYRPNTGKYRYFQPIGFF